MPDSFHVNESSHKKSLNMRWTPCVGIWMTCCCAYVSHLKLQKQWWKSFRKNSIKKDLLKKSLVVTVRKGGKNLLYAHSVGPHGWSSVVVHWQWLRFEGEQVKPGCTKSTAIHTVEVMRVFHFNGFTDAEAIGLDVGCLPKQKNILHGLFPKA